MAADKLEGQMDFLGLIEEYTDSQGATVRVKTPAEAPRKPRPKKPKDVAQITLDFIDLDEEFEKEEKKKLETVVSPQAPEPEEVIKGKSKEPPQELLFKQCKKCWCRDCKHNARNEAVPREMCGMMIPCPACQGCIDEDMATICEIGNAKEGCMFRAIEEGIYVPETVD